MDSTEYDIQRYDWRVLLSTYLHGRCLDIASGTGTRTLLLAELCDQVFALEKRHELSKHLVQREDYSSTNRVQPVTGTLESLPFDPHTFDVIVATAPECARWFTKSSRSTRLQLLRRLRELLTDDGSLIISAHGWPTLAGLTSLLEQQAPTLNLPLRDRFRAMMQANARNYRTVSATAGFQSVDLYATVPTWNDPYYTFAITDTQAIEWVLEPNKRSTVNQLATVVSYVGWKTNILDHCYPHYLVVYSNTDAPSRPRNDATGTVLEHGRSRTAVLELTDGELSAIKKIPNRKRHETITRRETDTLAAVKSMCSNEITATLPVGGVYETRFGCARIEEPVSGEPLSKRISPTVDDFNSVLEIGFQWITDFQRSCLSGSADRSVDTLLSDLSFDGLAIDPPDREPVGALESVPVHGDYHPQNIFVDGGAVTAVIDWEHSLIDGNPLVDPTFFLFQTARDVFGDVQTGFRRLFLEDTPYASATKTVVSRYCTDLGVDLSTFLLSLPIGLIHQLKIENDIRTATSYTRRPSKRAAQVESIRERTDELFDRWDVDSFDN